ncbi:MAG: hypothetical protein M1816_008217 [Peltula sp. TS41687]|nr:MAG: hypothetical protein M1816_008217 [Peltula sp. TS41687]
MSPPASTTSGRKASVDSGKTRGKKRAHEETAETVTGTQAAQNGASSAGPTDHEGVTAIKPAGPGTESSSSRETNEKESKAPEVEDARKNNGENGGTVVISETATGTTTTAKSSKEASPPPPPPPFDPRQGIETFNWPDLEARYKAAMTEQDEIQSGLQEEFRKRINFFNIWAQSAVVHENERTQKRLRTRMHYVQRAERNLVEKREHYLKVVKAFETALALLSGL